MASSSPLLFDVSGWTASQKVHFIYLLGIDTNAPGWWEGDRVARIVGSGDFLDYAAGVAYKFNTGNDQWDLRLYKRDAKPWANPLTVYERCLRENAAKNESTTIDYDSYRAARVEAVVKGWMKHDRLVYRDDAHDDSSSD